MAVVPLWDDPSELELRPVGVFLVVLLRWKSGEVAPQCLHIQFGAIGSGLTGRPGRFDSVPELRQVALDLSPAVEFALRTAG